MAIITSPTETQKLMGLQNSAPGQRAHAISRCYGGSCPLKEGQKITLAFESKEHGRRVMKQYGTAVVRSIVEMPFHQRAADTAIANRLANGEGFSSAQGWGLYHARDGMSASAVIHRLQFDQIQLVTDGKTITGQPIPKQKSRPRQDPPQVGETKTLGSVDAESLDAFDRAMFGV